VTTMVERVAQAINEEQHQRHMFGNRGMPEHEALARAAIEAMREPTDEMFQAVCAQLDALDKKGFTPKEWFSRMVDAALKEGKLA